VVSTGGAYLPGVGSADRWFGPHGFSPGARAHGQVVDEDPPSARLLAIRGYGFELGSPISAAASENLEEALQHLFFLGSTRVVQSTMVDLDSDPTAIQRPSAGP